MQAPAIRFRVDFGRHGGHRPGQDRAPRAHRHGRLTPFGRLLIRVYRDFDAEVQQRAARSFAPLADLAERKPAAAARRRRGASVVRLKDR